MLNEYMCKNLIPEKKYHFKQMKDYKKLNISGLQNEEFSKGKTTRQK